MLNFVFEPKKRPIFPLLPRDVNVKEFAGTIRARPIIRKLQIELMARTPDSWANLAMSVVRASRKRLYSRLNGSYAHSSKLSNLAHSCTLAPIVVHDCFVASEGRTRLLKATYEIMASTATSSFE